MTIREVEMMHGAVLVRLCRSDKPVTLCLIETQDDLRPAYRINDASVLYTKHSVTPKKRKRDESEHWTFTFTAKHIADLAELVQEADVYIVLICGQPDFKGTMEIVLLEPDEWDTCLDLSVSDQQWLDAAVEPRKGLRVTGSCGEVEGVVSRNRLDNWIMPGS